MTHAAVRTRQRRPQATTTAGPPAVRLTGPSEPRKRCGKEKGPVLTQHFFNLASGSRK